MRSPSSIPLYKRESVSSAFELLPVGDIEATCDGEPGSFFSLVQVCLEDLRRECVGLDGDCVVKVEVSTEPLEGSHVRVRVSGSAVRALPNFGPEPLPAGDY